MRVLCISVSERSGSPPESHRIPSFQRHSGEGRWRECREARTGSSPRGTAWRSSSSSGTAGRCRKSPGGWASRRREKLHVEGLALPRVLLRSDEVGPVRQLREEPRRAVQGDPKGLVVLQADPGEAVGGVLARELVRTPAVRRRVAAAAGLPSRAGRASGRPEHRARARRRSHDEAGVDRALRNGRAGNPKRKRPECHRKPHTEAKTRNGPALTACI